MLSLAFLVGTLMAMHNGRRYGIAPLEMLRGALFMILAAALGSRLFAVIATGAEATLGAGTGGFAFYGGLIATALTAWGWGKLRGIDFHDLTDAQAPGLALGLAFGRTGCTLNGCCWGRPIEAPLPEWMGLSWRWPEWLSLTLTHPDAAGPTGVPLVPTQLLLAGGALVIAAVLWFYVRVHHWGRGRVFGAFLILYPPLRAAVELLRDDPRGFWFGDTLSSSQVVGVPLMALGLYWWIRNKERPPVEPA